MDQFNETLKTELFSDLEASKTPIRRGFMLYQQGAVYDIKASEDQVRCQVHDVKPVEVKLDLDDPLLSSCSCPERLWCRHRMAAFLSMYGRSRSVTQWMDYWKNKINAVRFMEMKNQWGVKLETVQHPLTKEDGPDKWIDLIENSVSDEDLIEWRKNPYSLYMKGKSVYQKISALGPIEREWKPLFELYTTSYLLGVTCKTMDESTYDSQVVLSTCRSWIQQLVEKAQDAMDQIRVHATPFAFDPYIERLRDEADQWLLTAELFQVERLDVYRDLWLHVFKKKEWRKNQVDRLVVLQHDQDHLTLSHQVALLHLRLLLNDRAMVMEEMKSHSPMIVSFSLYWIDRFFHSGQFDEAVYLLQAILDKIPAFITMDRVPTGPQHFMYWFFRQINQNWMFTHQPELMNGLYQAFLPYSAFEYSQFLLQRGSYRDWIEVQMFLINEDFDLMDKRGLTEIGKVSPELVLPIYHHGIKQAIGKKQRQSYKEAVRYLKKLRAAYRKLKQQAIWDTYFEELLHETKRLRAFHEECKRSKLVDA